MLKNSTINTKIRIIKRLKNILVHSYKNGKLFVSSRNKILAIEDLNDPTPYLINQIPINPIQKILKFRTLDRIMRNDIRFLYKTLDGNILVCSKNGWWLIDTNNFLTKIKLSPLIKTLARGVCESRNGVIYIGEYCSNPERRPIRIFKTDDLINFNIAFIFKEKSIRHVHAIIADPLKEERIWVLTGDLDKESKIFYTDNDFKTLNTFISEGQCSRATDLVFENDNIYWGTDSPVSQNFILEGNYYNNGNIKKIVELPGPVYYSCRNKRGGMYFSTTAEPGPYAEKRYARIFALKNYSSIVELYNCKHDFLPQHGIIYFPSGILPENYIVFTQRALKPYEGYLTIAKDESL